MGEIIELSKASEEVEETPEEVVEATEEEEDETGGFDIEFFSTPQGAQAMREMLKSIGENIPLMKEMWDASKEEFNLTEDQMHAVAVFNRENITPPTEEQKEDLDERWDAFNGLDKLTDEELVKIFGEDHDIFGPTQEITIQRVKECYRDLYNWVSTMKQYQETYDDWLHFQEMVETEKMNELAQEIEKIEDEEEKKKAQDALDNYWYLRNLGFLANPDVINDDIKKRIVVAYNDKGRLDYIMKRSLDKLPRLSIPQSWMLELNNFEKRFMDSKYSSKDDLLLLLVLQMLAFCKTDDKNDLRGSYVHSILFGVDSIIRGTCNDERKSAMLSNIAAYEDALLDLMDS